MALPVEKSSLKTVEKAVRILQEFSHDRPEISVSELSRALGIHKSIVSRLVSTLCRSSLLHQDPETRKIRIGVGAFRLGSIYASRQEIVRKATPFLATLVSRIGQSAHAMVLDGSNGLVVATVESPSALRVIMRVGEHRHLHSTASGKVFLAFSPPTLLESIVKEPGLVRHTPATITDPDVLRMELETVKATRIGWNNGENHAGAGGVAAPVLDDGGHVVTTLSVVYPLNVPTEAQKQEIAAQTLAVSEKLSEYFRSEGRSRLRKQ
ncbi:IclR family transcriptional regulator [Aquibium sp. LZ166]|uniref:IclR family transcriptional regulator n=1 Tax=Aquibium pacificus TaxID=3153579 RepID=A0ABV3SMZ0_9HYPH